MKWPLGLKPARVTPRKRRVSRNEHNMNARREYYVTPRKRRVSRNAKDIEWMAVSLGHASQEACE